MSNKWKDRLLSSSIPLEYEVGRILKEENYYVDFDFTYQRLDDKEEKEFSIDLSAMGFSPFNDSSKCDLEIELLIECKYRNPDVKWAFLPNLLHDDEIESEGRRIIHYIDEFSEFRLNTWDKSFKIKDISNKGVEINISNGEVHDTGIHHGVSQLIFAMPVVLARMIGNSLENALEDVQPYAYCSILVTTADLKILNKDFSIEAVKNAETLENISRDVPFLIFRTDLYPSFEKHCKNLFKDFPEEDTEERFEYYNDLQSLMITSIDGVKNEDASLRIYKTEQLMNSLKRGKGHSYFDEIIICNLNFLPELISSISKSIDNIGKKMDKINKGSS